MILAAVDDLLFRSKIRTVATELGVEIVFARSAEEVIEQTRARKPALVILDLNSQALEPLATLEKLKADAALADVRTLGFVSHVQAGLIESARAAGADEVLARSAFAARLPEILTTAE